MLSLNPKPQQLTLNPEAQSPNLGHTDPHHWTMEPRLACPSCESVAPQYPTCFKRRGWSSALHLRTLSERILTAQGVSQLLKVWSFTGLFNRRGSGLEFRVLDGLVSS